MRHLILPFGVALVASTIPRGAAAADLKAGPNPVEFQSGGETVAGVLYLPAGYKDGQKLPAVVVDGPWTQVKEQVAARYARELADRGLAALAFDHRHWGRSGGTPRSFESPKAKVEDLRAGVAFLRTVPAVDPDRIGGLGVCFGASYVLMAAAEEPHLKAVATVAAWLHDPASIKTFYTDDGHAAKLAAGRAALARFQKDGTVEYVPAGSTTDPKAAMYLKDTSGGGDYYTSDKRGVIPAWRNEFAVMSWVDWLALDSIAPVAPKVTVPLLMLHSDQSALPQNAKRFHALAKGPKDLLWAEGRHLDFYDRDPQVSKAADAAAAHFRRALGGADDAKTRGMSVAGVKEFFAALEARDVERFLKVWAEDGVQEMPFAPGDFPKKLDGRAAIRRQYEPLPKAYLGMKFPIRRLLPTADPRVVVAEYDGSIGLKTGGRYDNRYVGVFAFDAAGKLAHYTEYFDPFILLRGFPGAAAVGAPADEQIVAALKRLPAATDGRDWKGVRAVFADEVDVDYTSVAGGRPGVVRADDLVKGWEERLGKLKKTKHNFSDFVVTLDGADAAKATFTGISTHEKDDGKRWTCGGDYSFRLARTKDGWRVTAAKFDMRWEQGER